MKKPTQNKDKRRRRVSRTTNDLIYRVLVTAGQKICQQYFRTYQEAVPTIHVAAKLAGVMQEYTQRGYVCAFVHSKRAVHRLNWPFSSNVSALLQSPLDLVAVGRSAFPSWSAGLTSALAQCSIRLIRPARTFPGKQQPSART